MLDQSQEMAEQYLLWSENLSGAIPLVIYVTDGSIVTVLDWARYLEDFGLAGIVYNWWNVSLQLDSSVSWCLQH